MADWTAFATAFFRDSAGYINDRKDKAEDYADKLREQAERNKSKLGKLKQAAKAQQGFINQARGLYASDAQIEAALDSGPTGLRDLVAELSTLKNKYGNYYDQDLVSDYAKLPEGFKATGNLDPMSRYGLTGAVVGDTAKPDGGWLSKALGTDAKARARAELDAETVGDTGYSVYDLAQISDISGYESMNPTSFLSFTAPKLMAPNSVPNEIEDFDAARRTAAIEADRRYDMRVQEINSTDFGSIEEKKTALKKAEEDRNAEIQRSMENFINARRALYDNYDELMKDTLTLYGFETAETDEPVERKAVPEVSADQITSDKAPSISMIGSPAMPTAPEEVAKPTIGLPEEEAVTKGEPTGLMTPPTQENVEEGYITLKQWEKMNRKQRKAAGLPTSKVGVQQIVRGGLIKLPEPEVEKAPAVEVESVKERAEKKFGISKETLQESIDAGHVTEMDLQLLADHADEILDYIESKNYALNSMGVSEGLSEWAEENKKQLPFDLNFMIRSIISTLKKSKR